HADRRDAVVRQWNGRRPALRRPRSARSRNAIRARRPQSVVRFPLSFLDVPVLNRFFFAQRRRQRCRYFETLQIDYELEEERTKMKLAEFSTLPKDIQAAAQDATFAYVYGESMRGGQTGGPPASVDVDRDTLQAARLTMKVTGGF